MKIGLCGFGVVGRGVYEITEGRSDMQVTKVLCLEDIQLPDAEAVKDFSLILNDPEIDTVVEAMGGLHPSFEFVSAALKAGKNVVTSNKALVCTFYDELIPLANQMGVKLRCTAAVGGGIGWLSELERSRRAQKILSVGGIMNGTCNYVLDSMTRLGLDYGEALKQAQSLGYAEANPSTDVEGIDTWHKTILSANVAFGISVNREQVPVCGIDKILAEDVAAFAEHGMVCKLIGAATRGETGISACVQPTLFAKGTLEAAVPANYNLITFRGESSGIMSFYGQGAGRYPTAYNVVQDCVDLLEGKGFYSPYGEKTEVSNQEEMCYYVRGEEDAWLAEHTREHWGSGVITDPVRVQQIHSWRKAHPNAFLAALPEGV